MNATESAASGGTSGFVRALMDRAMAVERGGAGWEAAVGALPAKACVVALEDEAGRTQLLGTTADARAFVGGRCAAGGGGAGKRADIGAIAVKAVAAPVGSAFEADLLYLAMARERMLRVYRQLMSQFGLWVVRLSSGESFPEPLVMELGVGLDVSPEALLGPVLKKHAARLGERVVDAFDLCRYPSILKQAPRGVACAYKEMGRCPAPCDGSETMESYRARVGEAVRVCGMAAAERVAATQAEMRQAAVEGKYEEAGALKKVMERLAGLDDVGADVYGLFRHVVVTAGAGKKRELCVSGWSGGRFVGVWQGSDAAAEGVRVVSGAGVEMPRDEAELDAIHVLWRRAAEKGGRRRTRVVRIRGEESTGDVEAAVRAVSAKSAGEGASEIAEIAHDGGV